MLQAVPPLALSQSVNFLFRGFQHFRRGAHLLGHHLLDVRGGLVQLPKHGLVPDDVGVADYVGSRGGDFHELQNVVSGIFVVIAQLLQLIQHRHRVDGLGEVEHGINGFKNLPILLKVKVLRLHNAHHVGNAPAVDEDRTKHRLLRFQGLGQLPGQKFFVHAVSPFFLIWRDFTRFSGFSAGDDAFIVPLIHVLGGQGRANVGIDPLRVLRKMIGYFPSSVTAAPCHLYTMV